MFACFVDLKRKMLQRKRFSKKKSKFWGKIDVFLVEVQALKYGDYSPKIIYWKSDANSCFSRHTVGSEENGVRVGSLASQSIFDQTHFWAVITTEPVFSFFEVFNFRLKMHFESKVENIRNLFFSTKILQTGFKLF